MKRNILLTVIILVLCGQLLAGTPSLMNYQGRLTTAGGTPVADGNNTVVFTIYDAASSGTSKWFETQSITTSGGLFAVLLGSITPITDTVFNGATRYLGVKVGADPELFPRTRLASVPYTERVNTLDGSAGGSISGNISLDASSATSGNILKEGTLFLHNFGSNNVFVGLNSGNLTMTGTDNVATGESALKQNINGNYNTAIGQGALRSNTTGDGNVANGASALVNNTTGSYNMASGTGALQSNTTGDGNTASGYAALNQNASGVSNTAIGKLALYSNTTGGANTANGENALSSNTTGYNNTASGQAALQYNTTGVKNTASGHGALQSNTTGDANTAIGDSALHANTAGYYNTSSGYQSLSSNTSGVYNTADGGAALFSNTTGIYNTASGSTALRSNTTGSYNTASGLGALYNNTTGSNNTAMGWDADVSVTNLTNATAIGSGAIVNASNKIRLGNTAVTVIEGQVAYTFTSDRNQKENFQPVDGDEVLRKISGLSLTTWNYKKNDPAKFRHYGPMAQEFYAEFGHDSIGTCGDSVSINSGDMAGITLIAVQTLEREKELLKAKVETIQVENAELKSRLATLEARLDKIDSNDHLSQK